MSMSVAQSSEDTDGSYPAAKSPALRQSVITLCLVIATMLVAYFFWHERNKVRDEGGREAETTQPTAESLRQLHTELTLRMSDLQLDITTLGNARQQYVEAMHRLGGELRAMNWLDDEDFGHRSGKEVSSGSRGGSR